MVLVYLLSCPRDDKMDDDDDTSCAEEQKDSKEDSSGVRGLMKLQSMSVTAPPSPPLQAKR